jgi:hypothetical protein
MKRFFTPNIEGKGRWVRALLGVVLLVGAVFSFGHSIWLATLLAATGGFTLFEAFRGWCLARACGMRTRW